MNTVKSFEFEAMRHNVTPSQFLYYVRSRVDAKGGKYIRSDLDLDYFKRGNDLNFDVQHAEECDYLYERSISKPYEMQTYMRYIDGTVYNEICEFTFDDEKTGHGYYYLVCIDPVAESVEENKAESLERIAKRFEDKAEKAAKGAEEIREDLECTDGMMECHVNAMRYEAERYEQVAQENAEKAKKCREVINSTTGEELAENKKEVNTMTTENTNTTTVAEENTSAQETAETEQQKTDRENREHCKRIADELEAVAEGRVYKCPECGELVGIENLVYDEDTQTYTCTQCGKTFDDCDLEPVYMLDYFADVLDIEYRIGSDREFRSVRLLVAYGGPNIYIDTCSRQVELYWWTDRASFPLSDEVCDQINADFEELFNC